MPVPASRNPPTAGPTMRLALLAPTSSDIAVPICSRPTTSPIITRRTGLSVHQPHPLMKLASARCQISSCPVRSRTREDRGGAAHQQHDDEQRRRAIKAFRKRAEKHPEETHRQQTEHGHHRDQKRRIGALVDHNPDRDGFHPAHGGDDQADIPQTPEVRRLDHPPERRVAHAIASSPGNGLPRYVCTIGNPRDRTSLFHQTTEL